ncbi:MAG: PQQ-dependent sugar dehydrogenase [Armatimonadetes bacterium]|nr:PQQ-dependent sugar dehydrogenase [Armatimonadota bacterium]
MDSATAFRVEVVATDLRVPWSIVFAPDGRIFFTERPGRVRVMEKGKLREQPLLTLPDVDTTLKLGLMGMALHPQFKKNHRLYLAYAYRDGAGQRVRVVRYHERKGRLTDRTVIFEDIPAASNHAGCRIKFGPDGKLYVTTGDADRPELSQRLDSLAGKTLRLNEDGSVPKDNPFVGRAGARPEIWSYGHRNAQGLDWQPGTGVMFQSEHGPNGGDEVNIVERGRNYGWPVAHHRVSRPGMDSPLLEYTPSIAPASGMFYRGSAFPQFRGNLFVGCLRGESILRVVLDGRRVVRQERLLEKRYGRIREVAEAPDGTIYFSTSQHDPPEGTPRPAYDQILRLVPDKQAEEGPGSRSGHRRALPGTVR